MPQLQIIDRPPSFGENLGRALGGGISEGISSRLGSFLKQKEDKAKIQNQMELLKSIVPGLFSQQDIIESNASTAGTSPAQEVSLIPSTPSKPNISDQQIAAVSLVNPNFARVLQDQNKMKQKERIESNRQLENKRNFEFERAKPVLLEADELSKTFNARKSNLNLAETAINEGNLGGFDSDYLAEIFNYEPLRSKSGAQLKSAVKDNFIKTISSVGSRPNQWVEQQVDSAMIKLGKSKEANLAINEIAKAQLDIEEQRLKNIYEISDKYEKDFGFVPGKIGRLADEATKSYTDLRQEQLAYSLRELYEKEQGPNQMARLKKVTQGTPLTKEMAKVLLEKTKDDKEKAIKLAEQLGYTLPSPEIYLRKNS